MDATASTSFAIPKCEVRPQKAGDTSEGTQKTHVDLSQENHVHSLRGSNDSKDKTQVASTTSMAVIHVGILKAILDLGPSHISYYDWCLGFVISALALQFTSGVIAIYIAMMKSFLSEFKYDFNYYCKRCLCPCIFKSKSKINKIYSRGDNDPSETDSLFSDDDDDEVGCFSCCNKSRDTDAQGYEEMLFDTYNDWTNKNFKMQLKATRINQELAIVGDDIADLEKARQTTLGEVSDADHPRVEDVDKRLAQAKKRRQRLMKLQQDIQILERKGDVLQSQIKKLMNEKVMKKAAFWQCILTILTYIIFALNTIITGFGLANLSKVKT